MSLSRLARACARTVFAMLLTTAPLTAGQAGPPAETARIGGTVTEAVTGAPVSRARVVATRDGQPPYATISGADGKYIINDVQPGTYTVTVSRTGFVSQEFGQRRQRAGTPIPVGAGQQVTTIDFALAAAYSISGRILDEDGSPFAGADVQALLSQSVNGTNSFVAVASARTDDHGEFRLFGLAAGQYYVGASDPAFNAIAGPRGVVRHGPTYYPGGSATESAKPIAVNADQPTPRVEFQLRLLASARVTGQVVPANGGRLLNVAVSLTSRDDGPSVGGESPSIQPDGRFVFADVEPGRYQLRVRAQTEGLDTSLFAAYALDVMGKDVSGLMLTMQAGARIEGRVSVESRRGAKAPSLKSLRVRAPFTDGTAFGEAPAAVQSNGTFAVHSLMQGARQIIVEGLKPPWVLKSVVFRGSDITDRPLDLNVGEQLRDVRITITDESSLVQGTVRTPRDEPAAHTGVLLFSQVPLFWMPTNRRMRAAYTDADGRFSVPGLPAGDYVAIAATSGDAGDLGRPDRLREFQAKGVAFRLVSDGAQADVKLQVIPR